MSKKGWVVAKWRTDYLCWDYFSGGYSGVGCNYPVWGYFPWTCKVYKTKAEAEEVLISLKDHRRRYPTWWHRAKSEGGYGLEPMEVKTLAQAQRLYDQSELATRMASP